MCWQRCIRWYIPMFGGGVWILFDGSVVGLGCELFAAKNGLVDQRTLIFRFQCSGEAVFGVGQG